jgi:hypothetical protein
MSDSGEAAEADGVEARIKEDGKKATKKNAGEEMEKTLGGVATEHVVKAKESGGIENQMIERNVSPGIGEPAPDLAVVQSSWEKGGD